MSDTATLPTGFHDYHYENSVEDAAKAVRHRASLWKHGRVTPSGRDVLDVGCGFGIDCVIDLGFGARSASGVDFRPDRVAAIGLIPTVVPELSALDAKAGKADALPYDDAAFDVVTASSAISHFENVDGYLQEARRVLRPGGLLLFEDDNNLLSARTRRRNHEWWRKQEFGPFEPNFLWDKPFADQRAEILTRELGLNPQDARLVAERTVGVSPEAYRQAGQRFLTDRELPQFTIEAAIKDNRAPIDPVLGQPIEQMYSPYELRDRLRALGFDPVRVAGYWGGASGKLHLRAANAALTRLSRMTIGTAHVFQISATRS